MHNMALLLKQRQLLANATGYRGSHARAGSGKAKFN